MGANEFGERWANLWNGLGLRPPEESLRVLLNAWSEPHRAYHTLQHLAECFALFDCVAEQCREPAEVELALWFHDAVYDPRRDDNESRSADWAAQACRAAGYAPDLVERLAELVIATSHHAEPDTPDQSLLVDIDLAILGADPDRFDEYDRQVRVEYAFVPLDEYRQKRAEVLASFLEHRRIYRTDYRCRN